MEEINSLLELPNVNAIFVIYGRKGNNHELPYVGHAEWFKERIFYLLFGKLSKMNLAHVMNKSECIRLKKLIIERLHSVIDPETNVDVIQKRLVNHLTVDTSGKVNYTFKPSSPFCPIDIVLAQQIMRVVAEVPGVSSQQTSVEGGIDADEDTDLLNSLFRTESQINPLNVKEIRWWMIKEHYTPEIYHSAKLIAREILTNKKLSSNDYKYFNESMKKYYNDEALRSSIKSIIKSEPSGVLKEININNDFIKIRELRKSLSKSMKKPIAKNVNLFNNDEKEKIIQNIWEVDNPHQTISFFHYLAFEHKYNELILDQHETRALFAYSMALSWLSRNFLVGRSRLGVVSALASLIGTDYELDIDAPSMHGEIYKGFSESEYSRRNAFQRFYTRTYLSEPPIKKPSIPYSEHFKLWPEFQIIKDAPIKAKIALIYLILRVGKKTGFVSAFNLPHYDSLNKEINYLENAGLVNVDPSPGELLGCLTSKELIKFATEKKIILRSRKKQDLIDTINSYASVNEIEAFINYTVDIDAPIRPLIKNIHPLYDHVLEELDRLMTYRDWIASVKLQNRPVISEENKAEIFYIDTDESHDDLKSSVSDWYLNKNKGYELSSSELQQIEKIWDRNCDQILIDLVNKYLWYWYSNILSLAIVEYLPKHKLYNFKRGCKENCTNYWYHIIGRYGIVRIHELGIKIREPEIRECLGCGKDFLETSITHWIANRIGYKILFCFACYRRALHGAGKSDWKNNREEMANNLSSFVNKLDKIPLAGFMQDINLSDKTVKEQTLIVKHLLDMHSFAQYVNEFGSWMKALEVAGVIDEKSLRTKFGYHCLAIDGHECLSSAEKIIDDWLFNNYVEHEKEPNYPYHPLYNSSSMRRADWKANDVFIEYAGLMGKSDYSEKMIEKQKLAIELSIQLIILEYEDLDHLDEKLDIFL